MAAQGGHTLRTVVLCLLAWVVMGIVSLFNHAIAVVPTQAPVLQIFAAVDAWLH